MASSRPLEMINNPKRMAAYIILGVLCLTACVSIAISGNESGSDSDIAGPVKEKEPEINIGDNDND